MTALKRRGEGHAGGKRDEEQRRGKGGGGGNGKRRRRQRAKEGRGRGKGRIEQTTKEGEGERGYPVPHITCKYVRPPWSNLRILLGKGKGEDKNKLEGAERQAEGAEGEKRILEWLEYGKWRGKEEDRRGWKGKGKREGEKRAERGGREGR